MLNSFTILAASDKQITTRSSTQKTVRTTEFKDGVKVQEGEGHGYKTSTGQMLPRVTDSNFRMESVLQRATTKSQSGSAMQSDPKNQLSQSTDSTLPLNDRPPPYSRFNDSNSRLKSVSEAGRPQPNPRFTDSNSRLKRISEAATASSQSGAAKQSNPNNQQSQSADSRFSMLPLNGRSQPNPLYTGVSKPSMEFDY